MGADKQPYREGRLKRRVRQRFASKESRTSVPKKLCRRERRIVRTLCAVALLYFVGTGVLAEMGYSFWMQAACMVQGAFWCALAGLYDTASDWQREASFWTRIRNQKIAGLLEETSGLSETDAINMTGEAADFGFATGDEVAEAFRREFGDE